MKTLHLAIIAIIGISLTIMSFPESFALGYGSIAKPAITSVPLRIFHLGVSVKDIQCKENLHLIVKAEATRILFVSGSTPTPTGFFPTGIVAITESAKAL